jgi:hypothetical protein
MNFAQNNLRFNSLINIYVSSKKTIVGFFSIIGILGLVFLFYMIVIIKAGPINSSKDNSVELTGIVDRLSEGGVKDLVFKLQGDPNIYYINRALEDGFALQKTRDKLLGKEITLWYAKHRSDPGGHLLQLQHLVSIYYTEWEIPLIGKN